MKITFVLPFDGRYPVGGFKVVYEYANRLVEMGHHVTVMHPAGLYLGLGKYDWWLRNIVKYLLFLPTRHDLPKRWFDLDSRVVVRWVPSLRQCFIPCADVIIATAWETAEWVASYRADRGRKFYLIQHLEDWSGDRARVINTWKLPLQKIAISRWLGDLARSLGESSEYIPNGLDFRQFGVDIDPAQRDPNNILMLHHSLEWKGTKEGLAAVEQVRAMGLDVKLTMFGVEMPKPDELPDWVRFEQLPTKARLRQLYNEAAIFVSPSWAEGWALPPAEAMQCGCATVLTDIGGHEYAIQGKTSLLSEPKDSASMAHNMLALLKDNDLRIRLARSGVEEIAQYTWTRASSALEAILIKSA